MHSMFKIFIWIGFVYVLIGFQPAPRRRHSIRSRFGSSTRVLAQAVSVQGFVESSHAAEHTQDVVSSCLVWAFPETFRVAVNKSGMFSSSCTKRELDGVDLMMRVFAHQDCLAFSRFVEMFKYE